MQNVYLTTLLNIIVHLNPITLLRYVRVYKFFHLAREGKDIDNGTVSNADSIVFVRLST